MGWAKSRGRQVSVNKINRFADFCCELHKNASGGRALPGPTAGELLFPRLYGRYKGEEGNGKERVGNSREGRIRKDVTEGMENKGKEGTEGENG